MAQGVGTAKQLSNGRDTFGGRFFGAVDYAGPASYVQGGDSIDVRVFGMQTILALYGSLDQTKTYRLEPRPMNGGVTTWQLVWTVYATGAEVQGGVNLSTYIGRLSAIGY
jgi:hypothetical protein